MSPEEWGFLIFLGVMNVLIITFIVKLQLLFDKEAERRQKAREQAEKEKELARKKAFEEQWLNVKY